MDACALAGIDAVVHRPPGAPAGAVVLTHGAGGSRESPLLVAVCDEWARRGWLALRYNLPFRRRRAKGPPSGSGGATDRAGVDEAIAVAAQLTDGPVIAGGHSYGGRLTSIAVAHGAGAALLTLFSYPLHPPGKPQLLRTDHFPTIAVPTVFTHGSADPFGSLEELRAAASLIPAPTDVVAITGAGHDLGAKAVRSHPVRPKVPDVAASAVDAALRLR